MRTRFLFPALLIGLVACSAPADGPTGSESSPSGAPAADGLAVSVADFMIDPSDLEAAGPTVTMHVTNDGPTPHNLTIRDEADEIVAATADLRVGESETLSAELEPGTYTIFCSLAGHESLGMSGTLIVTGP
jgi:plastocyanin